MTTRNPDRIIHTVRAILAGLVLLASVLVSIYGDTDGPPWVAIALAIIAALGAWTSRVEVVIGLDLDGDGHVGPPPTNGAVKPRPSSVNRLNLPILLCALAPLLAHCAHSPVTADVVHVGVATDGAAVLSWTEGQTVGVAEGAVDLTATVRVCAGNRDSTCAYLTVRAHGGAVTDEPPTLEACARLRVLWVDVERCTPEAAPPQTSPQEVSP